MSKSSALNKATVLETANLNWENAHTPISNQYEDIYFSADNGLEESTFVYLQNNFLAKRFQSLDKSHFTIAETGFGTGLNFLLTWRLWKEHYQQGKKLTYITTECFPLNKTDLEKCLQCWPELNEFAYELCLQYPLPIEGLHCIEFDYGITFVLLLGDATKSLNSLLENQHPLFSFNQHRAIDAWFLDGFSPPKNPDLWSDELFQTMAKLSNRTTTLSSYTSSGIVRRGLNAAGFTVERVKGFGIKRNMIRGQYVGLPNIEKDLKPTSRTRPYSPFWPIYKPSQTISSVLIIGAGISGCTTAKTLAENGLNVTLIDTNSAPMQGASGNPQAVLFPKLSYETGDLAEFNLFSFLYAQRYYKQAFFAEAFEQCGMLQILQDNELLLAEKLLSRFQKLDDLVSWQNAEVSSKLANTNIQNNCLWFPQTGWIRPQILSSLFLKDKNFAFIGNTTITQIEKINHQWIAHSNTTTFSADAIIICNAHLANQLLPDIEFPLKSIRGQITAFSTKHFDPLKTIICYDGYICPSDKHQPNEFTCGSSYDLKDNDSTLSLESQEYNFKILKKNIPMFEKLNSSASGLKGRVEFRCSSPDYLPLIGPLPNKNAFLKDYQFFSKNTKAHIPTIGTYHEGLFVNVAHGSRGFSSAPISAAIIRSYLLNQPFPLYQSFINALNPARFLIRDIARRVYE